MSSSVVVARPPAPRGLILFFHGVGASAEGLVLLAQQVARHAPDAMVVSVDAPHASSFGAGRQWFSVAGITEENRAGRIAAAMPEFESVVRSWQGEAGLGPQQTTLVGFSQGAIMALESTQGTLLAARVIAMSGRFAQPPRRAPAGVVFRFIHGDSDPVIAASFSAQAAEALRARGADARARIIPGLGHGIDARAAAALLEYLG
jgi:phospholipase/carboxylesterase